MNDDLISRQAALTKLENALWGKEWDKVLAKTILEKLPTAEPEIIRCKDCKWFGEIGCAISVVDDTDKPHENDYCSFAERRNDG